MSSLPTIYFDSVAFLSTATSVAPDCASGFDWLGTLLQIVWAFLSIIVVMTFAGLSVVAERKVCAYIQGRYGPNRTAIPIVAAIPFVGNFLKKNGLMQLAADGIKFLIKEDPLPKHVDKLWYMLAPVMALSPVLICACVIPFGFYSGADGRIFPVAAANFDVSLIFALAVGGLGVYGAVMAGWSSNSKFPYIGAMRASSQVISYELAMGLSAMSVVLWTARTSAHPLNLFDIALAQKDWWYCISQPLAALIFLICLFAETNRLPFDVAESETDLVSGYHTEYGSFKFGLFFVGEYGHMVVGSALFITLFLGAWNPLPGIVWPESWGWAASILSVLTFLAKIAGMLFFMIWVRWTLPRFRYDQVMRIGWKCLLPLAILNFTAYMIFASI